MLSVLEASKKYGVTYSAVRYWLKKYSYDIALQKKSQEMFPDQDKGLAKELALAKTKIMALETMIKVAEDEFKIAIRKKFGTKQ